MSAQNPEDVDTERQHPPQPQSQWLAQCCCYGLWVLCVFLCVCSLGRGFPMTSLPPPGNPSLRPASASSGATGVDDLLISGSSHAGAPRDIKGLLSFSSDAICTPQIRHLCASVTLLLVTCVFQPG